jgi:predicted phosphodiesterase
MKFLHLSDLHFHRDQNDNQGAIQSLRTIGRHYPGHTLIITGDLTDDGHGLHYENAFDRLEPFTGRIFIAPGNHDFGAAGHFYSRERALRFDEMLSKPLKQDGTFTGEGAPVVNIVGDAGNRVTLIALDTNLETDSPFDFACGESARSSYPPWSPSATIPPERICGKFFFSTITPLSGTIPLPSSKTPAN